MNTIKVGKKTYIMFKNIEAFKVLDKFIALYMTSGSVFELYFENEQHKAEILMKLNGHTE